jgi:molybdopterin converting factor small subunit
MKITVHPVGSLKRFVEPGTVLEDVRTVGEAVEQLSLPESKGLVMLVNERLANWNTPLADGDTLQLIPTIAGG